MFGIAKIKATAAAVVQDDEGRDRAYLVPFGSEPVAYHVHLATGEYVGAGMSLQPAVEMAREKTGIAVEELPSIERSAVRIERGSPIKIVGFQGGGFYRVDSVYLGDKILGTLYTKNQPARRHNNTSHTSVYGENSCVMGHDLRWLLRQHGYRLIGY